MQRQAVAAAAAPKDGSGSSRAFSASGNVGSDSTNLPSNEDVRPAKEQGMPMATASGNLSNCYPYGVPLCPERSYQRTQVPFSLMTIFPRMQACSRRATACSRAIGKA